MGSVFIKPSIRKQIDGPPRLQWFKIYHKNEHAGDILASFELVKVIYIYFFCLDIFLANLRLSCIRQKNSQPKKTICIYINIQ